MGLTRSPGVQWRIIKNLPKAWKEINRTVLRRIINEFKEKRLVDFKENSDGTIEVKLTEKGEMLVLRFDPDKLRVKIPPRWDGKWRLVIFDIPEKKVAARRALRNHLRKLGFVQLQRSVWIFPYECRNEIDFLAELFEVRNYIHYIIGEPWGQDAALRLKFNLV